MPSLPKRNKVAATKTLAVPKTVAENNDMESENKNMEPPTQETVDVANSESNEDLDEDEIVHVAVVHHEENATNTTNEDSSRRHSWEKMLLTEHFWV